MGLEIGDCFFFRFSVLISMAINLHATYIVTFGVCCAVHYQ